MANTVSKIRLTSRGRPEVLTFWNTIPFIDVAQTYEVTESRQMSGAVVQVFGTALYSAKAVVAGQVDDVWELVSDNLA
jgi:hypothetical protein